MKSFSGATVPIHPHIGKNRPPPNDGMSAARLSADLIALRQRIEGQSITIGQLEQALKGRGFAMLLLFLALPFCFIPLPGLSTPFGLAVFLIGIRIAAGLKPRLPEFILQKRLSPAGLEKVLDGSIRVVCALEKIVKPRMSFVRRRPGMLNLIGVSVASGGLLLLLPLPIPFNNMIAAWAVVLLTAGMMERDGLLVLAGHVLTLAAWALIGAVWLLGAKGVEHLFSAASGL
jgi:hypothetical protein